MASAMTDIESGDVDAVCNAKTMQNVLRVCVERLVVTDEVVVNAAGLTHHGLRRPVEVVQRLRPRVSDVLDQFMKLDVVASM